MNRNSLRWMAAIVDRGKGGRAASIFHQYNHEILLVARAHGTAGFAVMDCLGLDEPEKDLVLGIASRSDAHRVMDILKREMEFHKPGHGIAFSLPLSGISAAVSNCLKGWNAGCDEQEADAPPKQITATACSKEDTPMTEPIQYDLIATVIPPDLSATVMEAARKAGCQGGTLIKAREIGSEGEKKIFGLTLSQEKVILLILTPLQQKRPILKAVCETVLKETGEHAIAISLAVDEVEGISG